MDLAEAIYGKLLFVSGKGGVGKTSTALALARLGAAQKRRTILVEIGDQEPSAQAVYKKRIGYEPVELYPNLHAMNIDWPSALKDWVEQMIPIRRVVTHLLDNPLVRRFLDATPGNREVVVLSKLCWLHEQYDLVVVDLPASGHAVSLLASPDQILTLFRSGPIYDRALAARELLKAAGTYAFLVALPEELVVQETVETWKQLQEKVPGLKVPFVVLNRSAKPTLSEAECELIQSLSQQVEDPAGEEVLRAMRWEMHREGASAHALTRLASETTMEIIEVPYLSRPQTSQGRIQSLSSALARFDTRRRQREG